jgi:hypothetical protein
MPYDYYYYDNSVDEHLNIFKSFLFLFSRFHITYDDYFSLDTTLEQHNNTNSFAKRKNSNSDDEIDISSF